jgi:hypothetical protein
MSSFDLGQQIRSAVLIPAQAWNGGDALTTADAQALDVANAEGVAVIVNTGAVTAGADIEIAFHEGDADDFTPASGNAIDDKYIVNSPEMDETENASYVHSIKTNKRYIKVVVSRDGTDAAAVSVTGVLGYLANAPA